MDQRVRTNLKKYVVDWERAMANADLRKLFAADFKVPKLEMCDATVSRVWARSRDAQLEFKDLTEVQRRAVSVARMLRLLTRLVQTMVSMVSIVGVDANHVINESVKSMHNLLQFIPGLGPRKAKRMLNTIYGKKSSVGERKDFTKPPFSMGENVYCNAAGFFIVKCPPDLIRIAQKDLGRDPEGGDDHKVDERIQVKEGVYRFPNFWDRT
eukprot:gene57667-biopygen93175